MKPLRKTKISRSVKSGYLFQIKGLPKGGMMPLVRRFYAFGANENLYFMDVLLTTTTANNATISLE